MEPWRRHKAANMKDTICTLIVIMQPVLCTNISSTKRVITHVTIKPLAGIPANNYAVMKSVKILTAEWGAYIKLLRSFFFFSSSAIVLQVRLSFLSKKCHEWRNQTRAFQQRWPWRGSSDFPSEPRGDGAPQRLMRSCLPLLFTPEWKAFSSVGHNESHVHGWNCNLP